MEITTQSQLPLTNTNPSGLIKYSRIDLLNLRLKALPESLELLSRLNVPGINYIFQQRTTTPCSGFRSIPTLKSSRRRYIHVYDKRLTAHRNIFNLAPVQCVETLMSRSNIKFGVWNAQSLNKKSGFFFR